MDAQRLRVLVVDDEEGMREGMARVLSRRAVDVELAPNGEAALELLAQRSFDIALLDLKMPGIDGFEVARRINETAADRTVVVIVSALGTVEAAVEVTRRGAFDFLVKPFAPQDLLEVFDRAAHQRELLREREQYLTELATERNTSRQLINSLHEGLVVLNVNAEVALMNPRAEYLLGVPYRRDLTIEELFEAQGVREALRELLSGSRPSSETVVIDTPKGDDMLRFDMSLARLQKDPSGAIVVVRDVTAEWRVEQDKNRFISMVAHELKSPLAAIINYLNVIGSGMLDSNLPKVHEILDRCKTRGEALLELVRDLLYLNRREAGKVEKNLENLDVAEVIQGQIEFLKGQADRRGVTTGLDAEAGSFPVCADRGDMDRIFMNLLSNGIKYNREKGRLDVCIHREGGEIVVSVSDTGIGMKPEEMEGLFQEFYRIRNRQTKDVAGTGLGLATVKRVLGGYNGRITVESVPGKGSTFTVRMPAGSEGAGEPRRERVPVAAEGAGEERLRAPGPIGEAS